MTLCWICKKNEATTGEHRHKKSLYKKINPQGKKLYKGMKLIPGNNSVLLKHEKNLCEKCNTALSQPWDRAYDKFINYLFANEEQIFSDKRINLAFLSFEEKRNLYKYFVKEFGCIWNEVNTYYESEPKYIFPPEFSAFLNGAAIKNKFCLRFSVSGKFIHFTKHPIPILMEDAHVYDCENHLLFTYTLHIGWLSVQYLYLNHAKNNQRKTFLAAYFPNYWNDKIPLIKFNNNVIDFNSRLKVKKAPRKYKIK